MAILLAAVSLNQLQEWSFSEPQGSKCFTKKLSVIVDTIDPVSTRHGTSTPPIFMIILGQAETKFPGSWT
jgi:hypothetical protein